MGIWNVYGEDQKRTNNNVEGWNSKFSKLVRKHHHNIFEFVDAIRKEQAATQLKTAQHDAVVQPARKKKKYIVAQCKQEYVNESGLSYTVCACGWVFAQTGMTVSDINVPTQNNNCPIQNKYYLNYTLTINNYQYTPLYVLVYRQSIEH